MVSRSYGLFKTDEALNDRNSGRETIVVTIVIVVRMIPERQISTFSIVLAIVLPPQFLWFKIKCPFDFCVN